MRVPRTYITTTIPYVNAVTGESARETVSSVGGASPSR